jgi:RNA polymerase sigma-70 factor (ECF subfamily)
MEKLARSFQKFLSLPEWFLLREAKLGDKEAFGRLYQTYVDRIFRFVFFRVGQKRDIAEDLVSDIFLKTWEKLDTFDGANFQAWLYMIARNRIIDFYRGQKPQTVLQDHIHDTENVEEKVLQSLEIERVQMALKHLTDEQQEIIIMKFTEDLRNSEIAHILGKKEEAIRAMQYRAIKRLKEVLGDE